MQDIADNNYISVYKTKEFGELIITSWDWDDTEIKRIYSIYITNNEIEELKEYFKFPEQEEEKEEYETEEEIKNKIKEIEEEEEEELKNKLEENKRKEEEKEEETKRKNKKREEEYKEKIELKKIINKTEEIENIGIYADKYGNSYNIIRIYNMYFRDYQSIDSYGIGLEINYKILKGEYLRDLKRRARETEKMGKKLKEELKNIKDLKIKELRKENEIKKLVELRKEEEKKEKERLRISKMLNNGSASLVKTIESIRKIKKAGLNLDIYTLSHVYLETEDNNIIFSDEIEEIREVNV